MRPRRPSYASYGDDALDLSLPLSYGPPPPPSTPAPYGSPSLTAMPSTLTSYRNRSPFAPSFASYGLGNNLPPYASASALIPDLDEAPLYTGSTYSLTPPKNYRGASSSITSANNKSPKESAAPSVSESSSLSEDDPSSSSSSYKFAASRLIPKIVKAPFKKIYKAFSSRKHRAFGLG